MSDFNVNLTLEDIEAHAASMEQQPWWGLFLAEQSLPPCSSCEGLLELLLDGTGWCEDCNA